MYYVFPVFLLLLYIASARYVLKRLPTRRAKVIVWIIIALTWGPALIVAFAPPSFFQPQAVATLVHNMVNLLLAVLLPLMPLMALGLGIARPPATPRSKIVIVGITALLGYVVLFADEIAGRIYFNHLCAT